MNIRCAPLPRLLPQPSVEGKKKKKKKCKQARKQAKSTTDHNSWESKGQTEFWKGKVERKSIKIFDVGLPIVYLIYSVCLLLSLKS